MQLNIGFWKCFRIAYFLYNVYMYLFKNIFPCRHTHIYVNRYTRRHIKYFYTFLCNIHGERWDWNAQFYFQKQFKHASLVSKRKLQHWPDIIKLLARFLQVLKKKGGGVITLFSLHQLKQESTYLKLNCITT